MLTDPLEAALFDIEAPPPVTLADKFLIPPFSVLDRRSGTWLDRKAKWMSLGIQSELGRDERTTYAKSGGTDEVSMKLAEMNGGTSIFDPVLCEVAYRWFTAPGARVLDPFAGGSVRGITASILARDYVGIELRPEQVAANRAQAHLGSSITPEWIEGDSLEVIPTLPPSYEADLIFTCPPYADLEVYSDDPRDLSTMEYPAFVDAQAAIIAAAARRLRPDRFAVWVTSDVRDPKTGAYRGLVVDTIRAFAAAGLALWNDAIVVDMVGTSAIRAERPFVANRKITRTHQHALVFVKGSGKRAAEWAREDGIT